MAFDISYYVLGPILAIGILYGCYTVLFTQCVYIFFQRRQGQYWLQISLLAIIFLLSTISIATGMMAAAWDLQHIDPALKELAGTQNPITKNVVRTSLLFLANFIGDIILLWRCHAVWGRRLWAILLPGSLCLINHGMPFISNRGIVINVLSQVVALVVIIAYHGGSQFVNLSTVYAPDKGVDRKHVIASNYINCGLYLGTAFTNIFITSLIGTYCLGSFNGYSPIEYVSRTNRPHLTNGELVLGLQKEEAV
ncbi:hypothetical protein VNI00_016695 [Paramarasmius palmivorus]|uniref:Uncharacterized protein n=1 Tax=Paramarasmius palmivorus TaxID=297713 RepID=A0AAW0BCN6_9AGAR